MSQGFFMAFLSISVLLLIALLARLGDWQLRFKILIWLIVGGFLYEIAGFFIVLAGIPLGGLMLDEAPCALAFVLFCLHVYPPKPTPRRQYRSLVRTVWRGRQGRCAA